MNADEVDGDATSCAQDSGFGLSAWHMRWRLDKNKSK